MIIGLQDDGEVYKVSAARDASLLSMRAGQGIVTWSVYNSSQTRYIYLASRTADIRRSNYCQISSRSARRISPV